MPVRFLQSLNAYPEIISNVWKLPSPSKQLHGIRLASSSVSVGMAVEIAEPPPIRYDWLPSELSTVFHVHVTSFVT